MLSRKPRQQRISSRKMYGYLLPFIDVQSMKNLNGKVRLNCKASFPYDQTCTNESCVTITRKEFSCSKKSLRARLEQSNLYRRMGDQNRTDPSHEVTLASNRSECKEEVEKGANGSSRGVSPRVKCSRNGYGLWAFFFLSLLFVCANCQTQKTPTDTTEVDRNQTDTTQADNQCALGIKTPGRTWPKGDIFLEDGQPLRLYCMLNETLTDPKFSGKNASDLVFFRHNDKMEPEYITVINSTTSMMYVEKLSPSEDMYFCKLRLDNGVNDEAVCLNKVVVGFKPQEPRNFRCISQNWEKLICTWDPVHNYIATKFSLGFKLPGRIGGRALHRCPDWKEQKKPNSNSCVWDVFTDPMYRQVYEYYTFILNAENILGNATFTYKFHHYAHVIPSKPDELSLVNKTYSSVMLHWKVPTRLINFPPGLNHRISYQSQYDNKENWTSVDITDDVHAKEIHFNLTNLQYANTVYDIRVFIQSTKATKDDSWSQFSDITVKTAATLPGQSPRTDIGSFEIAANSKNRDVYIYWQTIPAYLQNGDNFTYQIIRVEENGKLSDKKPSEKKDTYAKFKEISFESFKFEIVAANVLGESKQKSVVYVPRQSDKPPEPVSFTKIAFDGGLYELSWNPMSNSNITSYTIYWCENDRDRPYQCNGYLDWIHVPPNISIYNTTVPDWQKIYQFAIAANTAEASSGMVWASCTAIHNKIVGKMKSVWINSITSHNIKVGWRLECSDRIDIIKGFIIYYCPIVSPYNVTCKDPMMNTTVKGGPHTMIGDLTGLKPYTTYKLTVAVLTKNGEGHHSDPLYNTTLEAAPAQPQRVRITNVTNTTINVEWEPPSARNGMLKYYTVYYNENVTKVENGTRLLIQNLQPYVRYNITVSAWTADEGNRSDPIIQRTDIGIPGKTDPPKIRFDNLSQVHIQWSPPRGPGGNLDYYEIITADNEIHSNITTCDTECEKDLAIPDCSNVGRGKLYHFQVRAVNFGRNMERFEGPWSDPGEGNCFSSGPSALVWVVIWIIGCFSGVAFLLFLGYSSKRIWIKCKAMQDVEVKLPPGLQPNMKLLGKGNDQHGQQLSADSSGCSSGQESVTSSLTSDSHVSTDSGADLDPVPMSPTKLLESPPTWESSNLRQRYVSGSTKPDSSSDRLRWDSYVKDAKNTDAPAVDSLSLARSTPNLTDGTTAMTAPGLYPDSQQHTWSSTGYISMPSSDENSSNNPSPLPRGKGSTQGVYSVVGLAPSPMPRNRAGVEVMGAERNYPRTGDLIPLEPEASMEPVVVNPYVSLASLEQKTRNAGVKPQISSLGDFAGIDFVHQVREQQQQPPPYSISDKLSKPYVQAGLIDATKMLRPSKEHDDPNSQKTRYASPTTVELSSGRPPFAPNFADPSVSLSQSLIELPSNTYVPVDTARGLPSAGINKESVQIQNPYVAVSTLVSPSETPFLSNRRIGEGGDHSASSYPFSPQLIDTSKTNQQKLTDCNDPITRPATSGPASLPVVKQSSGYVTIAENPTRLDDNSTLQGSAMSYVPHQRVNKKSPPPGYQQNVGQTDEQYSKVTVVPTTT